MADNFTKQLIETVKNVVPLTNGLAVRSAPVQGTLSDMQNFKIEDGVLKLRDGSKTIAALDNKRFYFLKPFEFCGGEVLFGLDMQKRLYAWFENRGKTYTAVDSSYFHRQKMGENAWQNGVLFTNGTKFWAYDNQKYIMFFNDCGEIRLIVKDGGYKIDDTEERLYVDIKDATNRVFDIPPSLKADTRNVAPRITGEVRFARVNEMGVVSELTEPQYLQDWQSVIAARIPIQTFQYQNLEKISATENQSGYKYIYADDSGTLHLNESGWAKPSDTSEAGTENPAMVLVVCEDTIVTTAFNTIKREANDGNGKQECELGGGGIDQSVTIPKGIYLVLMDDYRFSTTGGGAQQKAWNWLKLTNPPEVKAWTTADDVTTSWQSGNMDFFEVELRSVKYPQYNVNQICEKQTKTYMLRRHPDKSYVETYFPQYDAYYYGKKKLSDVLFNNVVGQTYFRDRRKTQDGNYYYMGGNIPKKPSIDASYVFDISCDEMKPIFLYAKTKLYRLADNEELYKEAGQEHFTISITRGSNIGEPPISNNKQTTIQAQGKLYAIDKFALRYSDTATGRNIRLDNSIVRAYRYEASQNGYNYVYTMSDMDTLKPKGAFQTSVDVGSNYFFNESNGTLDSAYTDADFIANSTDVAAINDRFAIWNNNKIIGVSQRMFARSDLTFVPFYQSDEANSVYLYPMFSPVISLEYMNQRSFRYDLPMISRAMRNPNHLVVSNNVVYSFEDNRLWYGDAYDFMLTGYANLDGSLLVMIPYNEGVLACTTSGLYYVRKEDVQPVVNGRNIVAQYAGQTQVGGIVVAGNKIYLVRTEITDSGARIETANIISIPIEDVVFEGGIKTACNKRQIYIADDFNIFGFDTEHGIWNLIYNYKGKRIADVFILNNKLGVLFNNQIDETKAFKFIDFSEVNPL